MQRSHHRLAHAVANDGIARHHDAVARLVADLRRRDGVNPVLLDLLADSRAPDVVRERALGRLLADVERPLARRVARPAA